MTASLSAVQSAPVTAAIPEPGDIPRPWQPAVVQPGPIPAIVGNAELMEALAGGPAPVVEDSWRHRPICGVVTVWNTDWIPGGPSKTPPGVTDGLGMELTAQWCLVFNQSPFARRKRRWALCTTRGTALILCGIQPIDRPINPAAFPECVVADLPFDVAEQFAIGANRSRLEVARVPKQWTVALRRVDSVDAETEGGAL